MRPPASHSVFCLLRGEKRQALCFLLTNFSSLCLSKGTLKHDCHILSKWMESKNLKLPFFFFPNQGAFCFASSPWWKGVRVWQVCLPLWQGGPGWHKDRREMDQSWLVPSLIQWPWKVNFPDTVLWFTAFIPPVLSEHRTTFNFTSVISQPQAAEI